MIEIRGLKGPDNIKDRFFAFDPFEVHMIDLFGRKRITSHLKRLVTINI